MFASLSASAKALKDEAYNNNMNVSLIKGDFSPIGRSDHYIVDIDVDDLHYPTTNVDSKPIEDTVEDIINNPEIKILKTELNTVEELFNNLKSKGENLDVLFRIEKRIENLKRLIDQKSYV
jgi:hypothetical protein